VLERTERVAELLDAVDAHLERCDWTIEGIALQGVCLELGLKPAKALKAVYAAIEGRHTGLPLFDSIELLGRDRARRRIRAARERLDR
jgi:glutamyl-tRNA synthetase